MENLTKLSFADLEALRQYFLYKQDNPDKPIRPGSAEVLKDQLDMVCEAIDSKFEKLTTVVSGGTAKAIRIPAKKSRFE